MANDLDKVFGQQESMGATQAAIQGVKIGMDGLYPGLKDAPAEIGAEMKHMAAQGAHELAAALFNGSAFVMYPRGVKEDSQHMQPEQQPEHGLDNKGLDAPKQSQGLSM